VEPQAWLAVAIAMLGTAILEGFLQLPGMGGADSSALASINTGDLWCFGTAIGFGLMFARMEHHMESMTEDDAALSLTLWQLVALFVAMGGWSAYEAMGVNPTQWVDGIVAAQASEPRLLPALAWMGMISGAGVLWGETIVLKQVPSTEAGVIFATEPVWAAGFAAVILNAEITQNEIMGGAAICLACLALQLNFEQPAALVAERSARSDDGPADAAMLQ